LPWDSLWLTPKEPIIVATIIAVDAIGVFRDNLGLVLGKSLGPDYMEKVLRIAETTEGVLGVVGTWVE
jgi:divalent metal cation (Fe/Co/Zn/Cd) transporter